MTKTESWIKKNLKFADLLPKSDVSGLSDQEMEDKYSKDEEKSFYSGDFNRISKQIPKEVAEQISQKYPSLNFLGHGYFGVVYENKNRPGWLVKVTTDQTEIAAFRKIDKDGWKVSECIVPYGEYFEIPAKRINGRGVEEEYKVGVIETKKINRLTTLEKRWVNVCNAYCMNKIEKEKSWTRILDKETFVDYLKDRKNTLEHEFEGEGSDIFDKYMELVVCISFNGYDIVDLHGENVGKREDGRYYLMDVGLMLVS